MLDPAIFDMYYILVEILFGNILVAGLALIAVFIITAVLLKMSPLLQMFIIGMFIITFGTGYAGSIVMVAGIVIGLLYFAQGMIRFIIGKVLI